MPKFLFAGILLLGLAGCSSTPKVTVEFCTQAIERVGAACQEKLAAERAAECPEGGE